MEIGWLFCWLCEHFCDICPFFKKSIMMRYWYYFSNYFQTIHFTFTVFHELEAKVIWIRISTDWWCNWSCLSFQSYNLLFFGILDREHKIEKLFFWWEFKFNGCYRNKLKIDISPPMFFHSDLTKTPDIWLYYRLI